MEENPVIIETLPTSLSGFIAILKSSKACTGTQLEIPQRQLLVCLEANSEKKLQLTLSLFSSLAANRAIVESQVTFFDGNLACEVIYEF